MSYNKTSEANKYLWSCAGDVVERILIGGIECCYAKSVFSLARRLRGIGECKKEKREREREVGFEEKKR